MSALGARRDRRRARHGDGAARARVLASSAHARLHLMRPPSRPARGQAQAGRKRAAAGSRSARRNPSLPPPSPAMCSLLRRSCASRRPRASSGRTPAQAPGGQWRAAGHAGRVPDASAPRGTPPVHPMDARYEPHRRAPHVRGLARPPASSPATRTPASETYVIALPPPNVTGELHMGHALNGSIQDTLMRLHRMRGRNTLWICGTDHASIAVHAVIEKQLRAEGTTRVDVGREAFVERVWEWRRETGATIIQQLKRLGCTLDYDHERFTMDEGYVRAVMEMFVRLYDKGLHLPRQPHRQLVPGLRLDRVRSRGAPRARRRRALRGALPDHRHRPVPDRGHRAARDDPGRHGRGRAPRRRPLPPPGRQDGDRADRRPRGADHRRRVREDRLRHRRAQGHARARPQRLRDRAPPRPARDLGDRVRRPHDRRRPASSPGWPWARPARR